MVQFSGDVKSWLTFILMIILSHQGNLIIRNDGPAVVGSPITFTAIYDSSIPEEFIFVFQDKHNVTQTRELSARGSVNATFTYDTIPEGDDNWMSVKVWMQIFRSKAWVVASGENRFKISNNLIGHLEISQDDIPEAAVKKSIVATQRTVNISFNLHDPSGYFERFKKEYRWKVDDVEFENSSSLFLHNFTDARIYNVSVIVSAESPDQKIHRNVYMTQNMTAKDVIQNFKDTGKYYIYRDRSLDLNVSCDGSPPFTFCRKFFDDNSTAANFTCHDPQVQSNRCFFHVTWYFRNKGQYILMMQTDNDVSQLKKRVEISVIEVPKQPSLTFVVIPVACSIMAVVIIMCGVAFHFSQRERFTIEVADFDFVAPDEDNLDEKTFVQRIKDSLSESLRSSFGRRRNGIDGSCHEDRPDISPDTEDANHERHNITI